jgi:hypothetical protein
MRPVTLRVLDPADSLGRMSLLVAEKRTPDSKEQIPLVSSGALLRLRAKFGPEMIQLEAKIPRAKVIGCSHLTKVTSNAGIGLRRAHQDKRRESRRCVPKPARRLQAALNRYAFLSQKRTCFSSPACCHELECLHRLRIGLLALPIAGGMDGMSTADWRDAMDRTRRRRQA